MISEGQAEEMLTTVESNLSYFGGMAKSYKTRIEKIDSRFSK
jgi:hypothetical protein